MVAFYKVNELEMGSTYFRDVCFMRNGWSSTDRLRFLMAVLSHNHPPDRRQSWVHPIDRADSDVRPRPYRRTRHTGLAVVSDTARRYRSCVCSRLRSWSSGRRVWARRKIAWYAGWCSRFSGCCLIRLCYDTVKTKKK